MKINLSNAIRKFHPYPSMEMIYEEAIANSIDANANEIEIKIKTETASKKDSLVIEIKDNGDGFNEQNFAKFSQLLEVYEDSHKGVGRLIFLEYFNNVDVTSVFNERARNFTFWEKFNGDKDGKKTVPVNGKPNGTILVFRDYKKQNIHDLKYLRPIDIKHALLQKFYPLFYNLKLENKKLRIAIKLETKDPKGGKFNNDSFYSDAQILDINEIPEMKSVVIENKNIDLFDSFTLYYSIKEGKYDHPPITAICVDGRIIPFDILSKGEMPKGFEIIFLLYSSMFKGKSDDSRKEIIIDKNILPYIKKLFGDEVRKILNKEIPQIVETNNIINKELNDMFPHLSGYFDETPVGVIDKNEAIQYAQQLFFSEQKIILEANSLTDEQYYKSLEVASRTLTEYILFRNKIIEKLKKIDHKSSEAEIHNIIVPKRKILKKDDFHSNLFTNNVWLLDDKYMSYTTILSEQEMHKLLKEIAINNELIENDISRPDIALVFSSNFENENEKFDVVIVELKKIGLPLAGKEEVISQLRQRARKLLNYYSHRILRIWFYGIVDFDEEFIRSLREENYLEVYSKGNYFYKEIEIIPDYDNKMRIPIGVNLLTFDAFLADAEDRNATFLNILKNGFK